MKAFLVILLTISTNLYALELSCDFKINKEEVFGQYFSVADGEKVNFAEFPPYYFSIENLGEGLLELEIYDAMNSVRHYTRGVLKVEKDVLYWSMWSREALLELNCNLHNPS